jgi:hypothetical protein
MTHDVRPNAGTNIAKLSTCSFNDFGKSEIVLVRVFPVQQRCRNPSFISHFEVH